MEGVKWQGLGVVGVWFDIPQDGINPKSHPKSNPKSEWVLGVEDGKDWNFIIQLNLEFCSTSQNEEKKRSFQIAPSGEPI